MCRDACRDRYLAVVGKRSRHSRRMRNRHFCITGKRPMSSGRAWVDTKHVRLLASWAVLSISANDNTNAPHAFFKAWSMIVALIPVYDTLISSQSPHSSASNLCALKLLYNLRNDQHLFSDSYVTVWPVKIWIGLRNMSSFRFGEFQLILSNSP